MRDDDHDQDIHDAEQCRDYEPIAGSLSSLLDYEPELDQETEDVGCDSCRHWQNGRCKLYGGR